jgi:hypothetical protein
MNFLLELLQISERYSPHDWTILPATMALYNRRTVDIITAASTWAPRPTTILICKKAGESRVLFVSSSGDAYDHYVKDIGKSFHAVHDQTQASKGMYKLLNVAVIKDSKIEKSANDEGLKAKASLSVFK